MNAVSPDAPVPLTYRDAVERVREEYAEEWSSRHPGQTFYPYPTGYADADDYLVPVGAREVVVDGEIEVLVMGGDPAVFVDRTTGVVRFESVVLTLAKVHAMEPVE